MYLDNELKLADDQVVGAGANSEHYLDTEKTDPGLNQTGLALAVIVKATATGTTGFNIYIVHKAGGQPTKDDSNLSMAFFPVANLKKGDVVIVPFPKGVKVTRYLGAYFDRVNGDEAMTVDAYITPIPASGYIER